MIKADINELREKIVKLALMQMDKPYVHGAHGDSSFDCAGLVWYIYYKILNIDLYNDGIGLSTTTKIMTSCYGILNLFDENDSYKDFDSINIGDILFFHRQSLDEFSPREDNKYPGHCGIYLGDDIFIHCPRNKGMVKINDFSKSKYWRKKLVASKDVVSDAKVLILK